MACGYSESWAQKIDQDFACSVCSLICRDAVSCACGKLFCDTFLRKQSTEHKQSLLIQQVGQKVETWAGILETELIQTTTSVSSSSQAPCPFCGKKGATTPANFIRKKIADLKIYCPLRCSQVLRLGDKDRHLRDHCINRLVPCPKCNIATSFSTLEAHEKEECVNRMVICNACHEEVRASDLERHKLSCGDDQLIPCPVCKKEISQSSVTEHIEGNVSSHFLALLAQNIMLQEKIMNLEEELASLQNFHESRAPSPVMPLVPVTQPTYKANKVFVGGIPPETKNEDFEQYFARFGRVTDVLVMTDRDTGRPRGFGFVTFEDEESVEQVVSTTEHFIMEKQVECKRAVPKDQIAPRKTSKDAEENESFGSGIGSPLSYASAGMRSPSPLGDLESSDDRFQKAVVEGLFKESAEAGYYYYTGPLAESGHALFCDRFARNGNDRCCCRSSHAENYIRTQIMCKHGADCHFGKESCAFVHLAIDSKKDRANKSRGECNRGYFCSEDCPYTHHEEALKVWRKRGTGCYPRGFRSLKCAFGRNCKNKDTCTYYHTAREAFCSVCSRIGHPVSSCKKGSSE